MSSGKIPKKEDRGAHFKSNQAKKRKNVNDTKDSEWKPLPPVVINVSDRFKTKYTEEENYRAFKLFSIMDPASTGCISVDELKKVLLGGRK